MADYEPQLLDLLGTVLATLAGEVMTVRDGVTAWRAVRAHQPDVAVLDVDMPGLSGLEVTRLIRADPALARTRVVLTTGHAGADDAAAAAGADAFLAKPFTPAALRHAIRSLVGPTA